MGWGQQEVSKTTIPLPNDKDSHTTWKKKYLGVKSLLHTTPQPLPGQEASKTAVAKAPPSPLSELYNKIFQLTFKK